MKYRMGRKLKPILISVIILVILLSLVAFDFVNYASDDDGEDSGSQEDSYIPARIYPYGEIYSFYEDKIVWCDYNRTHIDDWKNKTRDVYLTNITTGETTLFLPEFDSYIDLYGDYYCYIKTINNSKKILIHKMSTNETWQVTDEHIDQRFPVLGEKYLVYSQWNAFFKCWGLWIYDLETRENKFIRYQTQGCNRRAVSENHVVWRDNWEDADISEIYIYNISTEAIEWINVSMAMATELDICGDVVVWEDHRNEKNHMKYYLRHCNHDIYLYNISSKEEIQITHNKSNQRIPKIHGNYIVWEDWRNDYYGKYHSSGSINNADIYYYDLEKKMEFQVTNDSVYQKTCYIYDGKIIWLDYRNNPPYEMSEHQNYYPMYKTNRGCDIYMFDIETNTTSRLTY